MHQSQCAHPADHSLSHFLLFKQTLKPHTPEPWQGLHVPVACAHRPCPEAPESRYGRSTVTLVASWPRLAVTHLASGTRRLLHRVGVWQIRKHAF